MIDYITIYPGYETSEAAKISLNDVVNGTGIALKSFQTNYDIRMTDQVRPGQPGVMENPYSAGKMVVELEGDIMGSTAALYWATRAKFASVAYQGGGTVIYFGYIAMQMTSYPEPFFQQIQLIGPPVMPIGLAGATITPWRLVFGLLEAPWFRGAQAWSQTIGPNVTVALTNFAISPLSNAPSWPQYTITGPINNPSLLWQGTAWITITTNLAAGQQIMIDPRTRTIRGGSGTNYYPNSSLSYGWQWIDPRSVPTAGKNVRMNGTGTTGATTLQISYNNGYVI